MHGIINNDLMFLMIKFCCSMTDVHAMIVMSWSAGRTGK